MVGQIIILHGPSSSGKSTLAKTLQDRLEAPFWHVSIDHLRDSGMLPNARFERKDFLWSEQRGAVFGGFHKSVAAYAEAGNNLIVEHILDTPGWADDLRDLLAPFDVFFVGLHCALEELNRRERLRGDRPLGSAEQDFRSVHTGRVYDLEINTQKSVSENVQLILRGWRSRKRVSEFAGPVHLSSG